MIGPSPPHIGMAHSVAMYGRAFFRSSFYNKELLLLINIDLKWTIHDASHLAFIPSKTGSTTRAISPRLSQSVSIMYNSLCPTVRPSSPTGNMALDFFGIVLFLFTSRELSFYDPLWSANDFSISCSRAQSWELRDSGVSWHSSPRAPALQWGDRSPIRV